MYAIKLNNQFLSREIKVNRFGELIELNRYRLGSSVLMAVKFETEDKAREELEKFKGYIASIIKVK